MFQDMKMNKNALTLISGLLIASGMAFGLAGNDVGKVLSLVLATATASAPIAASAIESLRMRTFSIELLVTIAVAGAVYIGEYYESAMVSFLFILGAYLEARTLEKTRASLMELMDMAPQEATVLKNGLSVQAQIEDVQVGDTVVVKSGGKVPVDGVVISGQAYLSEAVITGEPMPKSKNPGERVYSGTIMDSGYIEIRADRVGENTAFARLIELVEEAQINKSKTVKVLDRFASVYTPILILLSIAVYGLTLDLHLAITFLVIACPGALVIGAPVSNVVGIGNGAKNGVLIKGGAVMDRLSKVDTIVFDKTGTLTRGEPVVVDVKTFDGQDLEVLLSHVASAEVKSEHHLGRAIVKEAKRRQLKTDHEVWDFRAIKAHGIFARVKQTDLAAGNLKLMRSMNIRVPDAIADYVKSREAMGNTAVYVAANQTVSGVISIADEIRNDAAMALDELRRNGIQQMIMLTGDNKLSAEKVAHALNLDAYYFELLPEQKVEHVQKLRTDGRKIAMAGDGINDAPAIATADIGLAMGAGGTDISVDTADVVLMADQLMQFSHAYALSKATIRNMRQNIAIALATVFILLGGVLTDNIHLASGMLIHEASVLVVILNAMRLIKYDPHKFSRSNHKKADMELLDASQAS